jgi:multiple sugar transport system ATP-binding protein
MATLSLRSIEKSFGVQSVLKSVDLDVADGEFLTIVGPSGCGKSTLLRIVAGLEQHTSGTITIGAERVDDRLPSERDIAMVFQSYALYPHLTVFDNIAVPLRYRQLTYLQRIPLLGWILQRRDGRGARIENEVRAVARLLDIEHLLARKPSQLSGGQRQRVALGRAIVRQPKLFLMDEPLSNLDAKLRTSMRAELAQLHRRLKTTFLYVTHDQVEAMTMSDRVAVMFDGQFEQVDTPARIYARPATLAVAEFIGAPRINQITAPCADGRVMPAPSGKPLAPRALALGCGSVTICFRAENTAIGEREVTWTGVVTFLEDMGADFHVHVRVDGVASTVIVRAARAEVARMAIGERLPVGVNLADIHVFGPDQRRVEVAVCAA